MMERLESPRLTDTELQRKKNLLKESMNLLHGGAYINIDDDEKGFVTDYLEPGKLELHGHELHYDEENDDVMTIMKDLFPNVVNEATTVDAKANKSTIKKLANELSNDADLGAKCRELIKKDGDCSQELKDLAKENPNDSDLGAACRKMCK